MKAKKILIWVVVGIAVFFAADRLINAAMMRGVNTHYGLNQDADILLIGHSHLMLATDKERLEQETGMKVSKYCREGVNVSDKKAMVEHFLNSGHADSLKYVLYGVDLATFTGDGLSANSYTLFYPFMDDKGVDKFVKAQSSFSDYWLHKLIATTRFSEDGLKNSAVHGWFHMWANHKTNVIDIDAYKAKLANGDERHIQMNEELMNQFEETIREITDRGVKVILINTPTLDLLNDFEPEKYSQIIQWYTDYAKANPLVEFWDFNPKYQSDYSIFSDRLHLNVKGQNIITGEIVQRLNSRQK